MEFLEVDNQRRQALEEWELDDYGQDLSFYTNAFDLADQNNLNWITK